MNSSEYISVSIEKLDSNEILYTLNLSRDLQKYFRKLRFSLSYNVEISKTHSLLLIPAISIVFPLAIIKRKQIICKELDHAFYLSLKRLAGIFHKMYPSIPEELEIRPKRTVHTKINGDRVGLFYSGGLDSSHLLIYHRNEKPYLFTIWGTDIPLWNHYIWHETQYLAIKAKNIFKCGGNIFIRFENPLNLDLLSEDFQRELYGAAWWEGLQVGVTLPTLIAPVAECLKLSKVYIAGGIPSRIPISWSDRKEVYEEVRFADVTVISDESSFTRMDKARKIAEFLSSTNFKLELRSCTKIRGRKYKALNCSHCEKCIRTILELILAGIDPNYVGFDVNYATLIKEVKRIIETNKFTKASILLWSEIFEEAQKLFNSESYISTICSELKTLESLWRINLQKNALKRELIKNFVLISRRLYYTHVNLRVREKLCPLENIFNHIILEVLSRILEAIKSKIERK
ncbi:MAG: hypothetical protein QW096_11655 [Thermofilaceae archaeon]